nr:hypothetical protein [Pseudomonas sp. Q1-7]
MPWFVEGDSDYWSELNRRLTRYLEIESRRQGERSSQAMYLPGITTGFFLPLRFINGMLGVNVGGIPGDVRS